MIQYPACVLEVSVFGPHAGVVESRGNRMRRLDLTVGILKKVAEAAVEDSGATFGKRGGVALPRKAFTGRFNPYEPDPLISPESLEDAHGIRAPAHTRDYRMRETPVPLQCLCPRLLSDDGLEVANHAGERIGAHHGADDVVGRVHVGDPIAQGFICRVLERPGA